MTRAEFVDALRANRVTVEGVSGGQVHVSIDYGQRTSITWCPEEWLRCARGRAAVARWRARGRTIGANRKAVE